MQFFNIKKVILLSLLATFANIFAKNCDCVVLKFSNGYQTISIDKIKSLSIEMYPNPVSGKPGLKKTFSEYKKISSLSQMLGLTKPSEPGFPGALVTGSILIEFKDSKTSARTLATLNGLLEDDSYPEVIYETLEVIDYDWLAKQ